MATGNVYDLFGKHKSHSLEEQLELLAEIAHGFSSSLDISQTLKNAIEHFMEYMNAEAASIFLLENNNSEIVCVECVGPVDITGLRLSARQGIVGKAVATRTCQMIRDVVNDQDFAKTVDMGSGFHTRSILCTPLIVNNECIGALELLNKKDDDLFDEQDRDLSTALASYAALAIHNARMADALVEQERMRKELELAREIQLDLLPDDSDLTNFPVKGMNVPALEVSGDFYDFFKRDDGLIYFNLADVSGKGMNAAMLMAKASSLLHHLAKSIDDPGKLLASVNDEICETISHGMFITIVSGFIDTNNCTIRFSNAGHQPPLFHHKSGEFEELEASAPPLGILSGTEFPVSTVRLEGGVVYLFTDGVTESIDEKKKLLDVGGLIKIIENNSELTASKRLEDIVAKIMHPNVAQHDDITLMIIECCLK
ncbi:MAG TPA: GAF domain-containing protein [Thiotrichaceae bacterium]|jgi:sigma-B regulation protein RsbU (phosphoserine phosphatase)|nr:GAF domain-containing protein [Thiotrichaceae bacterium]HIM07487.1 GAF domain-containing protein [Gammaproteobacteria bacterium]